MEEVAKMQEGFCLGGSMVLPETTQFSYLDPHVGLIRSALEQGFSVSLSINSVGEPATTVYEVSLSEKSAEELIEESGLLLGADYEKPERHATAQFGADDRLRRIILDSLAEGFDIFLVPNKGVGEGTHYQLWCANYDSSQ